MLQVSPGLLGTAAGESATRQKAPEEHIAVSARYELETCASHTRMEQTRKS